MTEPTRGQPEGEPRTLPRVLVVDDDADIRELISAALADEGYQVDEAPDGDVALAMLERDLPDLIVLDWRMPGRHGAFVLDEVKERHPRLPVIVLTAEGRQVQRALADALRADAFIDKPFRVADLRATAERLLADRDAQGGQTEQS